MPAACHPAAHRNGPSPALTQEKRVPFGAEHYAMENGPLSARTKQFIDGASGTLMNTTTSLPSSVLAQRAAQLCLEHKANDVVILDLRGVSDMSDFFVIASGTSDTHVRALGERVLAELKRDGATAHHMEGLTQGRWVLLDYVDFVVHLFHPTLRSFYQLERLWNDAALIQVESQGAGA